MQHMGLSSAEAKENGERWLWQLCYGAEKAFQLNRDVEQATGLSYLKKVKGKDIRTIIENSDSKLLYKIASAERTLGHLVGELVWVNPLAAGSQSEPIEGRLRSYDLDVASISVRGAGRLAVVQFCEFKFDEPAQYMSRAPLVEFRTELPYKS